MALLGLVWGASRARAVDFCSNPEPVVQNSLTFLQRCEVASKQGISADVNVSVALALAAAGTCELHCLRHIVIDFLLCISPFD